MYLPRKISLIQQYMVRDHTTFEPLPLVCPPITISDAAPLLFPLKSDNSKRQCCFVLYMHLYLYYYYHPSKRKNSLFIVLNTCTCTCTSYRWKITRKHYCSVCFLQYHQSITQSTHLSYQVVVGIITQRLNTSRGITTENRSRITSHSEMQVSWVFVSYFGNGIPLFCYMLLC